MAIGNIPFISHGPKPTRSEALEYYRRAAEHFELDIRLYEEVQSVEGDDGNFTVLTSKGSHKAEKVVLATGFYGQENLMNIPGEELEKVRSEEHTSELQSRGHLVCRLLLAKKKKHMTNAEIL